MLERLLVSHPLACPDMPNLDSPGPIVAFLGDLGMFPDLRSAFASVPPYDCIDFQARNAGADALVRMCSTSRLAVSVVDTIPPDAAASLCLGWKYPMYSLVLFSMPVQACPVLDGRDERLHLVWPIKKADFGLLRPRRAGYSVFLIRGILARNHEGTDYEGLHPEFDRRGGFRGRFAVGPDGHLHTMTPATLRLRPVGGMARATIECRRFTPLKSRPVDADAGSFVETFARGPDVARMKLAQFKARRSGYSKRRFAGALGRLHQLCARIFELTSPSYRAPGPPEPPFAVDNLVRLRWLARDEACRRLNGRTGRVVTPGCERTVVRLAGTPDRLVSVANCNLSLASGRPRQMGRGLYPVLSPLGEHIKSLLERRMKPNIIATVNGIGGGGHSFQRRMKLFISTPEGASLCQALTEEALIVQRHLRTRVSTRAVVDPFQYPIVRVERVVPMPYTEAFRSVRRQAARRPGVEATDGS